MTRLLPLLCLLACNAALASAGFQNAANIDDGGDASFYPVVAIVFAAIMIYGLTRKR